MRPDDSTHLILTTRVPCIKFPALPDTTSRRLSVLQADGGASIGEFAHQPYVNSISDHVSSQEHEAPASSNSTPPTQNAVNVLSGTKLQHLPDLTGVVDRIEGQYVGLGAFGDVYRGKWIGRSDEANCPPIVIKVFRTVASPNKEKLDRSIKVCVGTSQALDLLVSLPFTVPLSTDAKEGIDGMAWPQALEHPSSPRDCNHSRYSSFYSLLFDAERCVPASSTHSTSLPTARPLGSLRQYISDNPDASREKLEMGIIQGLAYLHGIEPSVGMGYPLTHSYSNGLVRSATAHSPW